MSVDSRPSSPAAGFRHDRAVRIASWAPLASILLLLGCGGSERGRSPDGEPSLDTAVSSDTGAGDAVVLDSALPAEAGGADVRTDTSPPIEVCEPQVAYLGIRSGDGTASIASVQAMGCMASQRNGGGCWPGRDGGAPCSAIELVAEGASGGTCAVTLTSTKGKQARVNATVQMDAAHGFECQDIDSPPPRVFTLYPLFFEPPEIVVNFDGKDAGAAD